MCGGDKNTSKSSTSPDPTAMSAYYNVLGNAQNVAKTPYQPYGGELVAGLTDQQRLGIANINKYADAAQPYMQRAAGMAESAAGPIGADDINRYLSPYTSDVVNAAQAQFANSNAQALNQVKGNAISQGALGGNREGVAAGVTQGQLALGQNKTIADLYQQGYGQALNTALTEQKAKQEGAYSLANIGQGIQNTGLSGASAQFGAGTSEQQTRQAQDTAAQQAYWQEKGYPLQMAQWLAGITGSMGSLMGGTSSTTTPGPNPFSQIAGLGLGVAGLFMADGGRVPGYEAGGGVDRFPSVPESRATLMAQQQQLVAGHRRAQLFPPGTHELPVPHGMHRVKTEAGIVHFDPRKVSAEQVMHVAAAGRENELLDLGPFSKHDIVSRVQKGEKPIAVVERDHAGTEVRAAFGTHVTAPHQAAAMERTKSPGHRIHLEHPLSTLSRRGQHGIPHRDDGGGIAAPGGGMFGANGWVPNIQLVHGKGAPDAPKPQTTQDSLDPISKGLGGLKGAFKGPGSPTDLGSDYSPTGLGDIGSSGAAEDFGMGGVYRRGGFVHPYARGGVANIVMPRGYADGGDPSTDDFKDRFNAAYAPNDDVVFNPASVSDWPTAPSSDDVPLPRPRPRPEGVVIDPGQWMPASNGVGTNRNGYPMNRVVDASPTDTWDPDVYDSVTGGKWHADNNALRAERGRSGQPDGVALPSEIKFGSSRPPTDEGDRLAYADEGPSYARPPRLEVPPLKDEPAGGVAPRGGWFSDATGKVGDWLKDAGISVSPEVRTGILSMAAGMMAGKDPHFLSNVGTGAQAGLATYEGEKQRAATNKLSQAKLSLEVNRLNQAADLAHNRLMEETRYHTGLLSRENYKPLYGMTTDEGHPLVYDSRSGKTIDTVTQEPVAPDAKIRNRTSLTKTDMMTEDGRQVYTDRNNPGRTFDVTGKPIGPEAKLIQSAGKPGSVEHLATTLIEEREKQRREDPTMPKLSFEEAVELAHRAPNEDRTTLARISRAQFGWKTWLAENQGNRKDPKADIGFWEKRYGVSNPAGTGAGAAPPAGATPTPAPSSTTPTTPKPLAPPQRPQGKSDDQIIAEGRAAAARYPDKKPVIVERMKAWGITPPNDF